MRKPRILNYVLFYPITVLCSLKLGQYFFLIEVEKTFLIWANLMNINVRKTSINKFLNFRAVQIRVWATYHRPDDILLGKLAAESFIMRWKRQLGDHLTGD